MHNGFGWHARWAATALISAVCLSPPMHTNVASANQVELVVGEPYQIPVGLSKYANISVSDSSVVKVTTAAAPQVDAVGVFANHVGEAFVHARLFGFVPWRSVDVHVQPRHMVYLGGQSIGVALHVKGAMIVGYQPGETGSTNPLQPGDVIKSVDGTRILSSADLRRCLPRVGQSAHMTIHRGDSDLNLNVPMHTSPEGRRKLGVYVRDKTAGIGTLTFYDPARHEYGALGHVITDPDTGQAIEGFGSIYNSDVTGIVKGEPGRPGEKRGRFAAGMHRIGNIEQNTPFGLFGHMDQTPDYLYRPEQVAVALPSQVHPGPAQILTVLRGHTVQAFSVDIENVARQSHPTTRSMVIHVTDPRLLRETGGIVQGMSGSPIIQDGRLIGAVTHVFMSDSTRGYGLFAEWMLSVTSKPVQPTNVPLTVSGDIIAV